MVEKNKEYIVEILDNGYQGEGIAKVDNFAIFIPNAIKGEKCKIVIVKVNKNFAFGRLLEIVEESENRAKVDCNSYTRCGGCDLRHISYDYTLEMKQEIVQNLINKSLDNKIQVEKVIGMENPYHYRNKLQYPVGFDRNNKPQMGVYAKRSHEVIPVDNCKIQNEEANKIAKDIFDIIIKKQIPVYNEKTNRGQIRHIIVKVAVKTNEIMCVLVTNQNEIKCEKELVEEITKKYSNIKSVVKNINKEETNVILGNKNVTLFGNEYIEDVLCGYTFKISPMSFYQTNHEQTEKLYNKAIEYANISKDDIVLDLYSGIGTIGICAAKYAEKVYGIEIIEQAIEMAKENSKLNNVDNIEFILGDVEDAFKPLVDERDIKPNIIIVDPPRKGLELETVNKILELETEKIVYVSCNPASLVRDLKLLEDKYEVKKVQPVDMFPFCAHVESVCVLERL